MYAYKHCVLGYTSQVSYTRKVHKATLTSSTISEGICDAMFVKINKYMRRAAKDGVL